LASSTGNVQRTELEIEILKEEIAHLRAKDEEKTGVISYLEREREKDRDHYRSEAEMREEERDEDHLREKERAEEREREWSHMVERANQELTDKQTMEAERQSMKDLRLSLELERDEAKANCDRWEREVIEFRTSIEKCHEGRLQSHASLVQERSRKESLAEECNRLRGELKEAIAGKERLAGELCDVNPKLDAAEAKIKLLTHRSVEAETEANASSHALSNLQTVVDTLKTDLTSHRFKLSEFELLEKDRHEAGERRGAQSRVLLQKSQALETELAKMRHEFEEGKAALEDAEEELEEEKECRTRAEEDSRLGKEELREAKEVLDSTHNNLVELQEKLAAEVERREAGERDAETRVLSLESRLSDGSAEAASARAMSEMERSAKELGIAEVALVKSQLVESKMELQEQEEELQRHRGLVAELKQEKDAAVSQLESATINRDELINELKEAQALTAMWKIQADASEEGSIGKEEEATVALRSQQSLLEATTLELESIQSAVGEALERELLSGEAISALERERQAYASVEGVLAAEVSLREQTSCKFVFAAMSANYASKKCNTLKQDHDAIQMKLTELQMKQAAEDASKELEGARMCLTMQESSQLLQESQAQAMHWEAETVKHRNEIEALTEENGCLESGKMVLEMETTTLRKKVRVLEDVVHENRLHSKGLSDRVAVEEGEAKQLKGLLQRKESQFQAERFVLEAERDVILGQLEEKEGEMGLRMGDFAASVTDIQSAVSGARARAGVFLLSRCAHQRLRAHVLSCLSVWCVEARASKRIEKVKEEKVVIMGRMLELHVERQKKECLMQHTVDGLLRDAEKRKAVTAAFIRAWLRRKLDRVPSLADHIGRWAMRCAAELRQSTAFQMEGARVEAKVTNLVRAVLGVLKGQHDHGMLRRLLWWQMQARTGVLEEQQTDLMQKRDAHAKAEKQDLLESIIGCEAITSQREARCGALIVDVVLKGFMWRNATIAIKWWRSSQRESQLSLERSSYRSMVYFQTKVLTTLHKYNQETVAGLNQGKAVLRWFRKVQEERWHQMLDQVSLVTATMGLRLIRSILTGFGREAVARSFFVFRLRFCSFRLAEARSTVSMASAECVLAEHHFGAAVVMCFNSVLQKLRMRKLASTVSTWHGQVQANIRGAKNFSEVQQGKLREWAQEAGARRFLALITAQRKAVKARTFKQMQLIYATSKWVSESNKKGLLMQESALMTKMFQTKVRVGAESSALCELSHLARHVAFRAKANAIHGWKQGLVQIHDGLRMVSTQQAWRAEGLKGLILALTRIRQQTMVTRLHEWRSNLLHSLEVANLTTYKEAQRTAAVESESAMRNCLSSVQARIETVYSFSQRSGLRCLQNMLHQRLLTAAGSAILSWRLKTDVRMSNLPIRMHVVTSVLFGFDRLLYRRTREIFRKVIRVWQARSWSVKGIAVQEETKKIQDSPSKTRAPLSPVKSPVKSPIKSPVKSAVGSPKKARTMLGDINSHRTSDMSTQAVEKSLPKTAAERVKAQADVISQLLTTSARPKNAATIMEVTVPSRLVR